jgi:uncharacterized protein (TIGR03067 family)
MVRIVVGLLLAAGVCSAAPVPKSLKKQVTMDGRWEAVLMRNGGSDVSKSNPTVWDVRGDTITRSYRQPDGTLQADTYSAVITRPDTSRPDEIDYTLVQGQSKSLFRAVVKVTAEELTVRFAELNAPRPTDVTEGTDGWYYVFRRVEK